MKNLLFVCVNYNSYTELNCYLDSIKKAKISCNEEFNIQVYIADNSSTKEEVNCNNYNNLHITIKKFDNLGYLGGAFEMIKYYQNINLVDFLIISNVDVVLEVNFFETLFSVKIDANIGWIVPQIYSTFELKDRNPKILSRYSILRLRLLQIMFRIPLLHRMYEKTLYKKRPEYLQKNNQSYIYAGHGSFMIFTRNLLDTCNSFNYPIFLFGEEIYFGELIMRNGLKCLYIPTIKIIDFDHVSTGKMLSKEYYKANYEAITYIIKTFYSKK